MPKIASRPPDDRKGPRIPLQVSGGIWPCWQLEFGFQPPLQWDKFLFVVLHCGSPGKRVHFHLIRRLKISQINLSITIMIPYIHYPIKTGFWSCCRMVTVNEVSSSWEVIPFLFQYSTVHIHYLARLLSRPSGFITLLFLFFSNCAVFTSLLDILLTHLL